MNEHDDLNQIPVLTEVLEPQPRQPVEPALPALQEQWLARAQTLMNERLDQTVEHVLQRASAQMKDDLRDAFRLLAQEILAEVISEQSARTESVRVLGKPYAVG